MTDSLCFRKDTAPEKRLPYSIPNNRPYYESRLFLQNRHES